MAAHFIPNMFYILRKDFSDEERREILLSLSELIPVVSVDHAKVVSALQRKSFADFEDCLQSECAKEIGAAYIITRNVDDFVLSEIAAITPADFLDVLKNKIASTAE